MALVALGSLGFFPSGAYAACPNEAFRSGSSAELPDCRAYELVTPPDSNGRRFADLSVLGEEVDLFPYEPISPFRDSFLFSTVGSALRTPPGGNGRNDADVYEADRGAIGWQVVRHVSPTAGEAVSPFIGGVSSDHAYNFVFARWPGGEKSEAGSLAQDGEADYLGDPTGHFELTGMGSLGTERLAQGRYISPGGDHVIFSTGRGTGGSTWCRIVENSPGQTKCAVKRLEPEAAPSGTGAIYDRSADGSTNVVSLLPNDAIAAAGEEASYQGSSADGSAVAFKVKSTLYVRVDNALTEEVADGATYGGLSSDGSYLFYVVGGDIHRFDTSTEEDEEVNASGDAEMVNVSADGSHVYFISPSQLDGTKGSLGEPNMYVWEGGLLEYIGTVAASDTTGNVSLTNWTSQAVAPDNGQHVGPGADPSRTTPDGSVIVFESVAQLTPYDNAGHTEIYRYDTKSEGLSCLSCNPLQPAATADASLQNLNVINRKTLIHNITVGGRRVFFETTEGLVAADSNGINDIYEWQDPGAAEPTLSLISPADSVEYPALIEVAPHPNVLWGISPDGTDVFFLSQNVLVDGAGEGGVPVIYDARIGGGFPVPLPTPICTDVSTCRPAPSPGPSFSIPSSNGGSGNVKPRHRRCSHRKHSRKGGPHKKRFCARHKKGGRQK